MKSLTFLAAISALLLLNQVGTAQHHVPGVAKVLLLSGGQRDHHAYRRQTYLLQNLLEGTRQFEVTICEDAALLETPALQKYDVIVPMADRRDPEHRLTEGQQRALLKFIHDGKGIYSFHAFCCADPSWVPEMREMLGGFLAHVGTPNTKVHMGTFPLKITNPNHPISKGIADFEVEDELYYYLQTQGELQPLAVATYEGKEWPVLWARPYGTGRVCVCIFGHCGIQANAKDPLENASFQTLVIRGIAWAAGREWKQP